MENLEKNKIKERIGKVTSLFILLLVLISLGVSLYYNQTLQEQVNERDILIKDLTQKDSILNQIMDIKYDSVTKTTSYSYRVRDGKVLKYSSLADELDKSKNDYDQISEKHSKIINENNQNINDYNSLLNSFNSLNKDHQELQARFNSLVDKFNIKIADKNKLIDDLNVLADSLSSYKSVVRLIQSNYQINYSIIRNGRSKDISINADKLDSALVLLPYFRDRLKLDNAGKVWTVITRK